MEIINIQLQILIKCLLLPSLLLLPPVFLIAVQPVTKRLNSCVQPIVIFCRRWQSSEKKSNSCAEFEFYRLSHPEPPVSWPQRPSDSTVESLAAVHSELTEKERRRQNVVVTGMKELEGEDDVDAFANYVKLAFQ